MSPAQAKGKKVDNRTDIWAFGAVVYEMLTGKRAFGVADVSETLASVLQDEPSWEALPHATALLVGCDSKWTAKLIRERTGQD